VNTYALTKRQIINPPLIHEEEWSIIESRSPEVKVAEMMKEFELKTYAEHMRTAELKQETYWK
jgi:hypothetical protein